MPDLRGGVDPREIDQSNWGVSDFKAKCLSLVDEVAATGESIVITKRSRRMVMLVAAPADEILPSVSGWPAGQGKIVGDQIADNEASVWEHMA